MPHGSDGKIILSFADSGIDIFMQVKGRKG
jgi:hypothetical protein